MLPPTLALLLLVAAPADVAPTPAQEVAVTLLVEELRKAELLLDADSLASHLAFSFTFVEEGSRLAGPFAYLEPLRRLKERRGEIKELRFESLIVRVYGASAIASYSFHKTWIDQGARRRAEGWCSDVFDKRDDGVWLLVHRHRG